MPEKIEFTRVKSDINGNPRYVCHFLNFILESDPFDGITNRYELALRRARQFGGRKFHNKQYGGGIVFQEYNIGHLSDLIQAAAANGFQDPKQLRKAKHIEQLENLGLLPGKYNALRRLEVAAHKAATDYCNTGDEAACDKAIEHVKNRLLKLFKGGELPNGFQVNLDARGYALKIRDDVNTLDQRDWGGYGLMAPDNDNF